MKTLLAAVLFAAVPAFAQAPAGPPSPAKGATCADCGVVTSIRTKTKQEAAPREQSENKPSGLVATVPLGSGGGKPQVGSSTKLGREAHSETLSWEVIVRMDNGRFRVITLSEEPEFAKDDKVRVEGNRIVPRSN